MSPSESELSNELSDSEAAEGGKVLPQPRWIDYKKDSLIQLENEILKTKARRTCLPFDIGRVFGAITLPFAFLCNALPTDTAV